jgi:hypothetical protein
MQNVSSTGVTTARIEGTTCLTRKSETNLRHRFSPNGNTTWCVYLTENTWRHVPTLMEPAANATAVASPKLTHCTHIESYFIF